MPQPKGDAKASSDELDIANLPPVPGSALSDIPGPAPLSANKVEAKVAKVAGGIQVMALRKGFYKGSRKSEGNVFSVASMDQVGEWMKCMDPAAEAEHQKILKAKKLKPSAGK